MSNFAFVVQLDLRLAGGMSFWDAPDAMATCRIALADLCEPTDELPKSLSPLWWFSPETPPSLLSDSGFSPCDYETLPQRNHDSSAREVLR
jgi:hypothetical protein